MKPLRSVYFLSLVLFLALSAQTALANGRPVDNVPVTVVITFTPAEASAYLNEPNRRPAGHYDGTCLSNGVYRWTTNKSGVGKSGERGNGAGNGRGGERGSGKTGDPIRGSQVHESGENHPFCTERVGGETTVTLEFNARLTVNPSEKTTLAFTDGKIEYKANGANSGTSGEGEIGGSGWSIDLTQISSSENLLDGSLTLTAMHEDTNLQGTAVMTWPNGD